MRKIVVGLFLLISLCLSAQTATIDGTIEGKQLFSFVQINKLSAAGGLEFITSQPITPAGSFSVSLSVTSADVYVLQFSDGKQLQRQQVMVLHPNDKVTLKFVNSYQSLVLQDAAGSDDAQFLLLYQKYALQAEEQSKQLEQKYMQASTDEAKRSIQQEFEKFFMQYQQNNMQLVAAHAHLLSAGFVAMTEFGQNFDANIALLKLIHKALQPKYANHVLVKEMDIRLQQSIAVGTMAPEIEIAGVDGKTIKLSDYKGKYVLIDFWASWCGPCRRESPTLVKAYEQYKDKNFTIFSVSLDNNKEKWMAAIQADGLNWQAHGSSLSSWNCPVARRYNVSSIPHSLLIDPQGKVIAIGLRGEQLLSQLAQILGK